MTDREATDQVSPPMPTEAAGNSGGESDTEQGV